MTPKPDFSELAQQALNQWDIARVRSAVAGFGERMYALGLAAGQADTAREFCICAAIRMSSGEVIHGHRHNHCYDVVRAREGAVRMDIVAAEQGFVTSTGRFVDRVEGMRIQKASGRPSHYGKDGKYVDDVLFSEDLYPTPLCTATRAPARYLVVRNNREVKLYWYGVNGFCNRQCDARRFDTREEADRVAQLSGGVVVEDRER